MDVNQLDVWQAYFNFVGLVAGGLTGLIFIALSIQVTEVTARHAYVTRARITLGALTGLVFLCGLVLLPGQTPQALGAEGLVLFAVLLVDVLRSVRSFRLPGAGLERAVAVRTTLAVGLLVAGAIGCVGLLADVRWSIALVALATLLSLPVRIIQAWALLVAAVPAESAKGDGAPVPNGFSADGGARG
jgi:hypothetical protein